jgi:hypothetical protein
MIRYGKKTRKTTAEIIDRAVRFFGPGGLGLDVQSREDACVTFANGGGHVHVEVCEVEGEDAREVDIQSREWDYQAGKFLEKI